MQTTHYQLTKASGWLKIGPDNTSDFVMTNNADTSCIFKGTNADSVPGTDEASLNATHLLLPGGIINRSMFPDTFLWAWGERIDIAVTF